jgi:hypothetical protein
MGSAAELDARAQIHDALLRYCRGMDRNDVALAQSAYHEDGIDDRGYSSGPAWPFVAELVQKIADLAASSSHVVGNVVPKIRGSHARVESHVICYLFMPAQSAFNVFAGRYLDQFEQREGQWRIARRQLVHDWSYSLPEPAPWQGPPLAKMAQGSKDSRDPSWGFFDDGATTSPRDP